MNSSFLLLVLLLTTTNAASESATQQNNPLFTAREALIWKEHSKILDTIATCDKVCNGCRKKCALRKLDYYVSGAAECLQDLAQLRKTVPDWCTDDFYEYVATEQFKPSLKECTMDVGLCVKALALQAKGRLESGAYTLDDRAYQIAMVAEELSMVQDQLGYAKQLLKNGHDYVQKVKDAWEGKWLEQALKHLADPLETETRFADPVFVNYSFYQRENEKNNKDALKKSLAYLRVENRFVKEMSSTKIPELLGNIANLKNLVVSRRENSDIVLDDIKVIAYEAAEAQKEATNVLFETRHAETIDGELIDQDDELFHLYSELQDQRTLLMERSRETSKEKGRLVSIMRYLVAEISRRQKLQGCAKNEIMAPNV